MPDLASLVLFKRAFNTRTAKPPVHFLANKTALEINRELNAPPNLLKDLDLDIHKGNSLLRMMGRQATMDTAAAGQFVRDHPDEAQRLILGLKRREFKEQLREHIKANKSGLSEAEVGAFAEGAYRSMTLEMAALVQQQQLNTVEGPPQPITNWNDPHGSGGKLLISIMNTGQLSIREATRLFDNVGAFQPLNNNDTRGGKTLDGVMFNNYILEEVTWPEEPDWTDAPDSFGAHVSQVDDGAGLIAISGADGFGHARKRSSASQLWVGLAGTEPSAAM